MEAEFGYRTENDNTRNVDAAQKLMDEAQRLEPSVMVTERNWSALLEMQDRLFRQQMQLDTDLKTLLTREDAQTALTEMQESAEKFERQAGNLNEKYSSGCKALTESTKIALTETLNDTKKQLSDTVQEARKKNSPVRMDLNRGIDLVRGAVQLGRAVEQMTDDVPVHDGTTMPAYIDSKRRRKLRQRKPPSVTPRTITKKCEWTRCRRWGWRRRTA